MSTNHPPIHTRTTPQSARVKKQHKQRKTRTTEDHNATRPGRHHDMTLSNGTRQRTDENSLLAHGDDSSCSAATVTTGEEQTMRRGRAQRKGGVRREDDKRDCRCINQLECAAAGCARRFTPARLRVHPILLERVVRGGGVASPASVAVVNGLSCSGMQTQLTQQQLVCIYPIMNISCVFIRS